MLWRGGSEGEVGWGCGDWECDCDSGVGRVCVERVERATVRFLLLGVKVFGLAGVLY